MTLSTKIAHNTIIQIASKIIATILGLFTIAIMTRYLGKSGFGDYTTILVYLTFFATVADLGLTLVTVQLISKPGADQERIIGSLFGFRFVTAFLFLGGAILLSLFLPYSNIIKAGIALTAFSFLFVNFNQILVGIFQKNLKMGKVAIAETVSRLFLFLAVLFVYFLDLGLTGILVATVLSNFISFLFHYIFSRKFVKAKINFDIRLWKKIIVQSWPIAVTIFFNLIYLRTDTIILSLVKSSEEVGIYGAAYRVVDVLVTVPFMFAGIILPVLTRSWAEKNNKFFKNVLQKSFDIMIIMAIPILAGTYFTADEIINIIAGSEFHESAFVLKILMLASTFIFMGTMFSHAIIAIEKQKEIIKAYIFVAVTSLVAYIIIIPKFSYTGAAWITVYSELAIGFATFFLVYKYTKFIPSLKVFFKVIMATTLMSLALHYFNAYNLNLYLSITFSVFIYFVSLYVFGGITKKEILNILNKK
ncbi:MAG: flippase [Patescibacteria group bacterium]|jgi:O-antigen/teichoic acid export membrane protein|nr:flippase [Patescibacteria group bacterium]